MLKLAIAGAAGRMGGALIRAAADADGVAISAAIEHAAHPALGRDAGELAGCGALGVAVRAAAELGAESDGEFDLLLDFTTPAATQENLARCLRLSRGVVIGTTGIDADGQSRIREAANDIPVLFAANTSIGVNLCLALVETAAAALGDIADVEIVEAHHRHKVDAPSGTALALGKAAADALGKDLDQDGVFARHGHTGERQPGSIGFSTIRGGDIAGEHSVLFIGAGERLEITHRATDRKLFANGALKAALWLAPQPPGRLYTMRDVLGLG